MLCRLQTSNIYNNCLIYFIQSGKIITFLYAVVMAAVFIGLCERVAKEIIGSTSDIEDKFTNTTVKQKIYPEGKKASFYT